MKTTLNAIREASPCREGWEKLLRHLGKTKADDEPLHLRTILDSNGLDDALWCLRVVEGQERVIRLYAVWCAWQVKHLMTDARSLAALVVAERYANGTATAEEVDATRAARDAARDAARAAWDATRAFKNSNCAECWTALTPGAILIRRLFAEHATPRREIATMADHETNTATPTDAQILDESSVYMGMCLTDERILQFARRVLALAAIGAPQAAAAPAPVAVIEFMDGVKEPRLMSWNAMPPGQHRVYAAAPVGQAEDAARWQDIATAPKDGSEIWAFSGGEQARMQWTEGTMANGSTWALWVWSDELLADTDPEPEQPTHWMPLPPPPALQAVQS